MGNLWLKIKGWVKAVVFWALVLYVALFAWNNHGAPITLWVWPGREWQSSVVLLVLSSFLAGGVLALILRTTWATWRQVRQLRLRTRLERDERRRADMEAKAARLQTRAAVERQA